jgi:hypothetical protein
MSDPARDGYQCHGPMEPVGYLGEAEVVGMICVVCGVTRNMVRGDDRLRATVDKALYELAANVPLYRTADERAFAVPI